MELLFYTDLLVSACSLIVPTRNFLTFKRRNGTFSIHFKFLFYSLWMILWLWKCLKECIHLIGILARGSIVPLQVLIKCFLGEFSINNKITFNHGKISLFENQNFPICVQENFTYMGKNPWKISFTWAKRHGTLKLGVELWGLEAYQICSSEYPSWPLLFLQKGLDWLSYAFIWENYWKLNFLRLLIKNIEIY